MGNNAIEEHFQAVLSARDRRMRVIRTSPFLLAVVNEGGHAALYVRTDLPASHTLTDGRGFKVKTTRSGANYVRITADAPGLPPMFLKLVEYIVDRIPENVSHEEGALTLVASIDEFRRFVSRRSGRLSETEVRGTFAELWYLRHLLKSNIDPLVAVRSWRGPWARIGLGLHDFTFADGTGIEVKSARKPPTTIRVSSAEQLVPSVDALELLVLPLELANGANTEAIPFRDFAISIGNQLHTAEPQAGETWDDCLNALGLDLSDEWYDRYHFVPGPWSRFQVVDGFPHLEPSNLPLGIVNIRYSLELQHLAKYEIPFEPRSEE